MPGCDKVVPKDKCSAVLDFKAVVLFSSLSLILRMFMGVVVLWYCYCVVIVIVLTLRNIQYMS